MNSFTQQPPPFSVSASLAKTIVDIRQHKTLALGQIMSLGLVLISGKDAGKFLQNRTTSDILSLTDGQGQASALLAQKAQVISVFSTHFLNENYWLLLEKFLVTETLEQLEKYHIMEQFQAQAQETLGCLVCYGNGWEAIVSSLTQNKPLPTQPNGIIRFLYEEASVLAIRQPSFVFGTASEDGFCLFADTAVLSSLQTRLQQTCSQQSLGWAPLTPEILHVLQVENGIPKIPSEMDATTLLPETGLETLTVSYTKGCYLGQETVARVKTYGATPNGLMGVLFPSNSSMESLRPGSVIQMVENNTLKTVGVLKTVIYSPTLQRPIAFASLGKAYRTPGKSWSVVILETHIEMTVQLLPFYHAQQVAQQQAKAFQEQGVHAFIEGNTEAAIAFLQQAVRVAPSYADAWESYGVILGKLERYEEAIAVMHRLHALDPNRIMAHTNLSVFYMQLGDKERAEEQKAKATVLAFQLKMKEVQQKKQADMKRPPGEALSSEQVSAENLQLLEQEHLAKAMARRQNLEERIELFKEALKYNDKDPLAFYGMANAYLELEEFTRAVEAFKTVLHLQPNHSQAYLALGQTYEKLGNTAQAIDTYQAGVEVASRRGDRTPLQAMQDKLNTLRLSS